MGEIIRRPEALQRGATDRQLQRMCTKGSWRRLRPGSFTDRGQFDALDAVGQHRMLAESMILASSSNAVLSHQSAAVIHGLELWNTPLLRVHLTRDRRTGGRTSAVRHVHSAPLDASEVIEVDGLRVTSLARTILDLARTLPFEQVLVVGDHALHSTPLSSDDLGAAVASIAGRPGSAVARRVLGLLDGRSESVGESRSRALFLRHQLPLPEPQPNLYAAGGAHLGRVDFLLEELGVVGEFDGLSKYGRLVPDGQTPADVVCAEKLREDAIRAEGWEVVRWTWNDLATPPKLIRRVLDAIERAQPRSAPSGTVTYTPRP
ncbi:type IV toxin-antitoxin system AbiEi family antitoxin domain-containing protein [Rhodococcus sp. NPDC055112]